MTTTQAQNFDIYVQQWVQLDNQLKVYQEKIKEWREKRNALEKEIIQHASLHKLENVPIEGGKLKITSVNVQEPITLKYLERTLSDIIRDETQSKQIFELIKQKRAVRAVPEIKRFTTK